MLRNKVLLDYVTYVKAISILSAILYGFLSRRMSYWEYYEGH